MPVEKLISKGDKLGRIQKLQPLIKSGTIRFSRRHRALLDQLRQFPKAAHDDGPDAHPSLPWPLVDAMPTANQLASCPSERAKVAGLCASVPVIQPRYSGDVPQAWQRSQAEDRGCGPKCARSGRGRPPRIFFA
ncbi:MAG: hypothetical protein ACYSVY_15280 [Planctomycetota bacterium]